MSRVLLAGAGFAAIYLFVLTSLAPGDLLLAALIGVGAAAALRDRGTDDERNRLHLRPVAVPRLLWSTAIEMVRGSWRVVRFCLGAPATPGFVELPRDGRSEHDVALWALVTGEAPDEIVVDVDEDRDALIVHLIDVRDPDAVRARHREALARWDSRREG